VSIRASKALHRDATHTTLNQHMQKNLSLSSGMKEMLAVCGEEACKSWDSIPWQLLPRLHRHHTDNHSSNTHRRLSLASSDSEPEASCRDGAAGARSARHLVLGRRLQLWIALAAREGGRKHRIDRSCDARRRTVGKRDGGRCRLDEDGRSTGSPPFSLFQSSRYRCVQCGSGTPGWSG
jgi:hypothetical protein